MSDVASLLLVNGTHTGSTLLLHSTSKINAGEEICISYLQATDHQPCNLELCSAAWDLHSSHSRVNVVAL